MTLINLGRNMWLCLFAVAFLFASDIELQANQQKKSDPAPAKPAQNAKPAQQKAANGAAVGSTGGHAASPNTPLGSHPAGPRANNPSSGGTNVGPRGNRESADSDRGKSDAKPKTLVGGDGRHISAGISGTPMPQGSRAHALTSGSAIQTRPNGRISDVHDAQRNMDIHRGLNGSRRVVVERPDHTRIIAERGRRGFVQRQYHFGSHDFARRTFYFHGRTYDRFYRGYRYRGAYLEVYAPGRYYPLGFYGWVYNSWYRPVVYSWGWGGAPWFGYYGGYFSPYPSYPSAALWLTDFMISANLQADYQANQEAQTMPPQSVAQGGSPGLSPDVKQAIANEVKSQIALENNEAQQTAQNQDPDPASSGIERMFKDGQSHVFVVGDPLDVVDTTGTECALSGGDVLSLHSKADTNATAVDLVVMSSKGGQECRKSTTVTVAPNDLQEMQNHMRETIDQGLEKLQSEQGKGGLPQAPPSAQVAPRTVAFAEAAPPPDPTGAAEVDDQLKQADSAEKAVVTEAQQQTGQSIALPPPSTRPSISVGESIGDVTAALGQPSAVVDLGAKKILQYPDKKITLRDGKVVAVQ